MPIGISTTATRYVPPEEPVKGLLSKQYAAERRKLIDLGAQRTDISPVTLTNSSAAVTPSEPYVSVEPHAAGSRSGGHRRLSAGRPGDRQAEAFLAGTTSIQAADAEGWVVSVTPSGGWIPAFVAGDTGVGLSQRMQSFVLTSA